MADIMSKNKRRENMRAIKSVSHLEDTVSSEIWKSGIRFRRNRPKLYGKPDISIQKYKIVIFIDSCFWHYCPMHGNIPKTNTEFWQSKLMRNVERDKEVNKYYKAHGWYIKRVWEHEIKNDLNAVTKELVHFIESAKNKQTTTRNHTD